MGCYPPLAKFVSKALGKCNGAYAIRALFYLPWFSLIVLHFWFLRIVVVHQSMHSSLSSYQQAASSCRLPR